MVILAIWLILRRRLLGEGEMACWWILMMLAESEYDLLEGCNVRAVGRRVFSLLVAVLYGFCSEQSWATGWAI